jgi:hypothetical protein
MTGDLSLSLDLKIRGGDTHPAKSLNGLLFVTPGRG